MFNGSDNFYWTVKSIIQDKQINMVHNKMAISWILQFFFFFRRFSGTSSPWVASWARWSSPFHIHSLL